MADPRLSQHPVDILIRRIIAGTHRTTESDVEQIVEHIATAPFDPRTVVVPAELRGLTYHEYQLGSRAPSIAIHLVKRVIVERQWVNGTTVDRYLADIRAAVRAQRARLVVYERRGGFVAAMMIPTHDILLAERRGEEALPELLVVFSADRGIILSGYQVTSFWTMSIPENAQWLR